MLAKWLGKNMTMISCLKSASFTTHAQWSSCVGREGQNSPANRSTDNRKFHTILQLQLWGNVEIDKIHCLAYLKSP